MALVPAFIHTCGISMLQKLHNKGQYARVTCVANGKLPVTVGKCACVCKYLYCGGGISECILTFTSVCRFIALDNAPLTCCRAYFANLFLNTSSAGSESLWHCSYGSPNMLVEKLRYNKAFCAHMYVCVRILICMQQALFACGEPSL